MANTVRKWVWGETLLMRRVLVSAASNARKWVQGETLLMRRMLVSAANNARKWVQGKAPALQAANAGLGGQHRSQVGAG